MEKKQETPEPFWLSLQREPVSFPYHEYEFTRWISDDVSADEIKRVVEECLLPELRNGELLSLREFALNFRQDPWTYNVENVERFVCKLLTHEAIEAVDTEDGVRFRINPSLFEDELDDR